MQCITVMYNTRVSVFEKLFFECSRTTLEVYEVALCVF